MGRIDIYPSGSTQIPITASLLAYAEVTTNQGSITTEVDLTGLSVTVTVPAGRKLKITGQGVFTDSVDQDEVRLNIKEGATVLNLAQLMISGNTKSGTAFCEAVISPSAGTHTYKLSAQRLSGTGTVTSAASATFPSFIKVEDITGSQLATTPAQFVPVGIIAQAIKTTSQTGITSETDITGLNINITVQAGRLIRLTAWTLTNRTVGDGTNTLRIREGATQIVQADEATFGTDAGTLVATAIISPTAGSHSYRVTLQRPTGTGTVSQQGDPTYPAYLIAEDITPTPTPAAGAPGSMLAYAEITSTTGTLGPAESDIPGLSVNITVPAGRTLKVTGYAHTRSSVATDTVYNRIHEDGANRGFAYINETASSPNTGIVTAVWSPTAGAHTIKLRTARQAGTGNITVFAGSGEPSFILVEDITGSVWPAGQVVTSGLIASEAWTDWTPSFTNFTLGNGTVTAKYVKIGRKVTWYMKVILGTTSSMGTSPTFTLPVAMASYYNNAFLDIMGNGWIQDAGTAHYGSFVNWQTSTTVGLNVWRADTSFIQAGGITATSPMTWTTNDSFTYTGTYESVS